MTADMGLGRKLELFLLDLLYPNACPCCGKSLPWQAYLCETCQTELLAYPADAFCSQCGKPVHDCICGEGLAYDRAVALTVYEGAARKGVLSMKSAVSLQFGRFCGAELGKRILANDALSGYDMVAPVGFARYDYALRNYKDVYTGASRSTGYIRNTDKEKQYARSVVNQQISNLFSKNGISLSKQADLVFSIDPYTYQLTVSGNADRDTLSQIETLLNEGDNAKNIWTHAWICMHDADNEIVNSQANMKKANQYSLWHEVYETTGYDARNATYRNGTFIAEDGTDLLALFKEKAKNGAGYELYSNRWLEYAKNGWKKKMI